MKLETPLILWKPNSSARNLQRKRWSLLPAMPTHMSSSLSMIHLSKQTPAKLQLRLCRRVGGVDAILFTGTKASSYHNGILPLCPTLTPSHHHFGTAANLVRAKNINRYLQFMAEISSNCFLRPCLVLYIEQYF